jgi:sulfite exporter TauE/SafE
MIDLVVPFITGLTTGGLSCLAVQGGLLASSIASTAEKEIQQTLVARQTARAAQHTQTKTFNHPTKRRGKQAPAQVAAGSVSAAALPQRTQAAKPILIFLCAKLIAYTALGFLLGALGSVMQLSSFTRAVMQIAIGVFMLGTALNMLKVHPIFRYFVIEPPKAVTRFIRRTSKSGSDDAVTPAFLGALTVLIPCGVTQTMMALAIGSADAFSGAAILFAFTLGSSPLFFALAYLARKLGQVMEARFMKFAAIAVIVLALVSIDGGLNLMGSPLSFSAIGEALLSPSNRSVASAGNTAKADTNNVITLTVYPDRYAPNRITASAGKPAILKLVTNRTYG